MQPMGGRQLAPKGMCCNGSGGLYGEDVEIVYGPGIAGGSFPLLYRKSAGLATPIGPRFRTAYRSLLFLGPCDPSIPELCECPVLSLIGVWQKNDASCGSWPAY